MIGARGRQELMPEIFVPSHFQLHDHNHLLHLTSLFLINTNDIGPTLTEAQTPDLPLNQTAIMAQPDISQILAALGECMRAICIAMTPH